MNRQFTILTCMMFIVSLSTLAQNQYHMSQFMLHQPFINPAAQGSYSNLNGALFYKTQWTNFVGAPEIAGFNINTPLGKTQKNAIGLTLVKDKVGVNNNYDVSGNYSYHVKTGEKSFLSLGLGASIMMMQSNLGNVHTIMTDDPVFSGNTRVFFMPNFKLGAYYFADNFYVGLATPNLLKNRITFGSELESSTEFDSKNIHLYFHSGYQFFINETVDLMTSVLVKHVSGAPIQFGLNAQAVYKKKIGVGGAFRSSQEVSLLLNYQLIPELKLGYAYDLNFGIIGNYSTGTHEVMLIYNLVSDKKIPIIEVPRF